jgi:hypothetical protein
VLQGSNTAIDSNPSPTGTTPSALPGGSSDLTLDFGYYTKAVPSINTTPNITSVTLGSATVTLKDTAVLSGAYNPGGKISFSLVFNSVTVYSTDVSVNGNGSYTTPTGYTLPTNAAVTGTYQWNAVYTPAAGDIKNTSASDIGNANERVVVNPGIPELNTTPGQYSVTVGIGTFATIGFWHNQNGQALIKSFDGGSSATLLGSSLAGSYGNLFGKANPYTSAALGAAAGTGTGLAGLTNSQVAAVYLGTWKPSGLQKNTYVQAFAVSLGLYAGNNGGTYSVGSNGALFGVANNSVISVSQILAAANAAFNPTTGQFYGGDSTKTSALNGILAGINQSGETPGGGTVVSSSTYLMDSATLSGGYYEGGTLTFYLMAPGSTSSTSLSSAVYKNVVNVSGNGTYTTAMGNNPGGYLPIATGTYNWVVVYSGDVNNTTVTSPFGSEPWTVGTQTPTIITTVPSPTTVTLSTGAVVLKDTATLQDGNSPAGMITFTLVFNGNTVYTEQVTVNGNGDYTTVGYTLPTSGTVTGTYQWNASYSGDSKNAGDSEVNSPDERVVVSAASPTIDTSPSGSGSTGSTAIKGTKYLDITGNGFSSDDTGKPGVTIKLYKEGNGIAGLQTGSGGDTLVTTKTTDSDGTYSFPVSSAGIYYVQESVPSGYLQTGGGTDGTTGNTYYTVNASLGNVYSGYDFDDFQLDQCQITCISYQVYHNGCWTTVSDLAGKTNQGDKVRVTFTVPAGTSDEVTLVSYIAPTPYWSDSNAYQQKIYQQSGGTFGPGTYTLTVQIPNSYYQVDFVCGSAIDQLEPNQNGNAYGPDSANILYHAQQRFFSGDNDGTTAPSASALNTKAPNVPVQVTTSSGSQTLMDSAVVAGGYNPGGTITFYLMPPGSTSSTPLSQAVYTDVVTVSGNGTYTTAQGNNPGGYVATAAGTYQWVAVYSGNGNNNQVTSPFGAEPWNVSTPVSISGLVFCDNNLNGSYQSTPAPGEELDGGAMVGLYSGTTLLKTATTDSNGFYSFTNVAAGTYTVKLITPSSGHVAELSHGGITVPQSYSFTLASGGTSSGNNFAEVDLGSVSGTVFLDVNDSGIQGDCSGETGIPNVTMTLTGKDYLGNSVSKTTTTNSNGNYSFTGLLPSDANGYTLTETQPAGYLNGNEIAGNLGGNNSCNNTISSIVLPGCDNDATGYNFGEMGIFHGLTATIGFWHNNNGQSLIMSFGNTSSGLSLANWLAKTYPNLFGSGAPAFNVNSTIGTNLTNRSNSDVAAYFLSLFSVSGQKSYAQVLATAFAVFTTTNSLDARSTSRSLATKYGFILSNTGTGAVTYTVPQADWPAFGLTSSTATQSISQLLLLANKYTVGGKLNNGDTTKQTETNDVFSAINNKGDIGTGMALVSHDGTMDTALGQVYAGTYLVGVSGLDDGDTGEAELARIQDAIDSLNSTLAGFGVVLAMTDASVEVTPDVQIALSSTSVIGGAADGVLGVTQVGGRITIVTGWNYYLGSDATGIAADQFDFQTVVSHELGHAIGMGHSTDGGSVMYPTLGTTETRRQLTDSDINALHVTEDGSPEPLMAAVPNVQLPAGCNCPACLAAAAKLASLLGESAPVEHTDAPVAVANSPASFSIALPVDSTRPATTTEMPAFLVPAVSATEVSVSSAAPTAMAAELSGTAPTGLSQQVEDAFGALGGVWLND